MYNIFAESIFTATRIPPYDPTGMNPYAGTPFPTGERGNNHKTSGLFKRKRQSKA